MVDPADSDGLADGDVALFPDDQLRLVTFIFGLPIRLPVPHLHYWVLEMGGSLDDSWDHDVLHIADSEHGYLGTMRVPFVQLRVWQVKRERHAVDVDGVVRVATDVFAMPAANPEPTTSAPQTDYETVVEAVTQGARSDEDNAGRPVATVAFDRTLRALNEVIGALSAATKDPWLAPAAREQLSPLAFVASRPALIPIDADVPPVARATFDIGPFIYMLNRNVDAPPEPVDDEVLARTAFFLSAARRGQPFYTFLRLAKRASASLAGGDYAVAVLMAAASGEVLLNTVLRGLMVEEGRQAEIAARFDSKVGLLDRLRNDYTPRLGGSWNLDTWETAPGHFEQSARWVRHRVIHLGHSPTMDEAVEAVHGGELLESFLKDRLAENRFAYPKTAVSMLGREGMEARGLLSTRMKQTIDAVSPEMPAFWATISEV